MLRSCAMILCNSSGWTIRFPISWRAIWSCFADFQGWQQSFVKNSWPLHVFLGYALELLAWFHHSCAGAASKTGMAELIVDWCPQQIGVAMVCDCAYLISSVSGTPCCEQSATVSHIWGLACAIARWFQGGQYLDNILSLFCIILLHSHTEDWHVLKQD